MRILFLLLSVTFVTADNMLWHQWKRDFGKSYSGWENFYRKETWLSTLEYVTEHNKKFEDGNVTFRLEMNRFADFSHTERNSKFTRNYRFKGVKGRVRKSSKGMNDYKLPDFVDWRKRNGSCVSNVQYQGGPGSCFAFSAIGAIEGQLCKKTGKMMQLSVQQILDCDAYNCGGYIHEVFKHVKRLGGIMSGNDYPYNACLDCMKCLIKNPKVSFIPMINRFLCDNKCKFTIRKSKAKLKSYARVPPTENSLKWAVANVGPIAAGIDAGHDFLLYSGNNDIYYEPKCSKIAVNHAVLVVGYGTTNDGKDYWIVKNSWGEDWGARGYIRMSRNRNNNCGIATAAMYPRL